MKMKLLISSLLVGCVAFANAAADKVVGYFPYWSQYSQFYPKDVRYNTLTHVHYTSLMPSSDGSVALADENDAPNFSELVRLGKENNVQVIVSVGGMEQEGTLQEIASSEDLRNTFASNLVSWLETKGGTGIEIDWQNFTAENTEGLSALVDALQSAFAGKYTLSLATYPMVSADAYDPSVLNKVDYVTVFMPDQMTEEESALKPNQSLATVEEALNLLSSKGIEKEKLVPILYLYGKSFSGASEFGSSHSGIGSGNDGYLPYRELMSKFDTPDYKVSFDETSKSEIAVSSSEAIVFMGIPSVKAVASFVKSGNYGGVAVYDVTQDHHEPLVSLLVTIGLELRPEINYNPKKKI